jgi:hypothetical protein
MFKFNLMAETDSPEIEAEMAQAVEKFAIDFKRTFNENSQGIEARLQGASVDSREVGDAHTIAAKK